MHSRGRNTTTTVNATALLGFKVNDDFDEENDRKKKAIKKERI